MKTRFETDAQFLYTGFVPVTGNLESHKFIISVRVVESHLTLEICFLRTIKGKKTKKAESLISGQIDRSTHFIH